MGLRQFLSGSLAKGYMGRVPCALLLVSLMIFSLVPLSGPSELSEGVDKVYWTDSNTGSKIEYTDEHTAVAIGPSDRLATLRMPGGHDYSRPLPLVIGLHGYTSSGAINSASVSYTHLTLPTILLV